ncbi:MAG: family 43 glycosylhydrolase [Clostridia bacterium]|nr:family 43 glycosylhydrolase [Clostridia bacterium]
MNRLFALVKIFLAVILVTALFVLPCAAYNNPIPFYNAQGVEMPMGDPFVMKYNGTYYAYGGGNCYRSTDLVNWTFVSTPFQGEHSENLYAPEVFHWNGRFYCLSCPNGTTNYLFKSDKPEGPFYAVSGDLGGDIDASLFKDDDGTVYLTHAGYQKLPLYRLGTPDGAWEYAATLPQTMSGMWTEGASIFKRNGLYYMTFTGNSVLDPAYRVEYALSESLTEGWTEPAQNVLLLSTEGETTALGHNSVVIGPDLDTYYLVYHNRYPDGTHSIDRGFNLQRVLWNGEKPVTAVYTAEAENPALPDFAYRPADGVQALTARWLSEKAAPAVFTAEYNLVPQTGDVLFGYADAQNFCRLAFSGQTMTFTRTAGGKTTARTYPLPQNTAPNTLQCVRVQQTAQTLCVYVDGALVAETDTVGGGNIGYSQGTTIGYTAFSGKALGNLDHTAEKYVNATYDAVLANQKTGCVTVDTNEAGNALRMTAGSRAAFTLKAPSLTHATLTLRGKTAANAVVNVYLNGKLFAEKVALGRSADYLTHIFRSAVFSRGNNTVAVEVVSGEWEFYELATRPEKTVADAVYTLDEPTPTLIDHEGESVYQNGKLSLTAVPSPKGDTFAKTVLGNTGWGDYSVEVTLSLLSTENNAEAGLFLRAANVSDGEASSFRFRRTWYKQAYYVCVTNGAVNLYKHNYGETLLKRYPTTADFTKEHTLKITAFGNVVEVYLDGKRILTHTDNDYPFTGGKCGLQVVNGTAAFDNLAVRAVNTATATTKTASSVTATTAPSSAAGVTTTTSRGKTTVTSKTAASITKTTSAVTTAGDTTQTAATTAAGNVDTTVPSSATTSVGTTTTSPAPAPTPARFPWAVVIVPVILGAGGVLWYVLARKR